MGYSGQVVGLLRVLRSVLFVVLVCVGVDDVECNVPVVCGRVRGGRWYSWDGRCSRE